MRAIAIVALVACGTPAGSQPVSPNAFQILPDVPFAKLDRAQRIQFMTDVVVPAMRPLFQAHDAKKFRNVGCKTCHGEGAANQVYAMPNPALPALDATYTVKFKAADIEFMETVVKPTMARLLREPAISRDRPDGFGCLACHPQPLDTSDP